jgi:hypothetical protein
VFLCIGIEGMDEWMILALTPLGSRDRSGGGTRETGLSVAEATKKSTWRGLAPVILQYVVY